MKVSNLLAPLVLASDIAYAVAVPENSVAQLSEQIETRDTSDVASQDLWKRKGGGGGGGRGGGGGSTGGSTGGRGGGGTTGGGSTGGTGGRPAGSSGGSPRPGTGTGSTGGRGGTGPGGSASNTGGRTTTGTGPRPAYGGGTRYPGGATQPYRAGSPMRGGIGAPILLGAGIGLAAYAFWPGTWYHPPYYYPYTNGHSYYNRSSNQNETRPVACGCDSTTVCACEDTGNVTFMNELVGDGTYSRLQNSSEITVGNVNGTMTLLINGTLPNGTTAAGGTDAPEEDEEEDDPAASTSSASAVLTAAGWWPLVATVVGAVFVS